MLVERDSRAVGAQTEVVFGLLLCCVLSKWVVLRRLVVQQRDLRLFLARLANLAFLPIQVLADALMRWRDGGGVFGVWQAFALREPGVHRSR